MIDLLTDSMFLNFGSVFGQIDVQIQMYEPLLAPLL